MEDLEISNFDRAGIDYENTYTSSGTVNDPEGDDYDPPGKGFDFRRLNIHHTRRLCTTYGIGTGTDCVVHPQGNGSSTGNWPAMAGYYSFHANGIALKGASYVRISDVDLNDTDGPLLMIYGRHWALDDVRMARSYWEHPYFLASNWSTLNNLAVSRMCEKGYPDGAAGLFWAGTRDFTLSNSSIRRQLAPVSPIDSATVPDGVAFDCEANCIRSLFDNVSFCGAGVDGCDGAAAIWLSNPAASFKRHEMTIWKDSDAVNYGNAGGNSIAQLVNIDAASPTQQGRGLFTRNDWTPHAHVPASFVWTTRNPTPAFGAIPPGWYEHLNVEH